MNDNQRAVLAYLKPYLNKQLPSQRQLSQALKRPEASIQSTLGSLERAGLIQVERSGGKPGHNNYKRVLRYWREAPEPQEAEAAPRPPTIEEREAVLMQATK